jgi:hypothetical protein
MKLFSYLSAKQDEEALKSMTSLTVEEFEELCEVFGECWNERTKAHGKDPSKGGRKPILGTMEDRLFFILFYLKTYPLQQVLAFSFEMSQGEANRLIHLLSKVLNDALGKGGHTPPRLPEEVLSRLEQEAAQDYSVDGTERRIVRPSIPEAQRFYFSGKKHDHTLKNNMIGGLDDHQIKGLSGTYEGKKHDKKICDEEGLSLPKGRTAYLDSGYQGLKIGGVVIYIPKKKPRGGELTAEEKEENRRIASIRVVIEHIISCVKRLRIVKDEFRNTKMGYEDEVMELACGLHNFRSYHRRQAY